MFLDTSVLTNNVVCNLKKNEWLTLSLKGIKKIGFEKNIQTLGQGQNDELSKDVDTRFSAYLIGC